MSKVKFTAKWIFVFAVLSTWTFFVVGSIGLGTATDDLFNRKFNFPVYIENNGELSKASSREIIDFLFNHDFSSEKVTSVIPEESCSIRATTTNAIVNGTNKTGRADLSINVNYLKSGRGTLISRFEGSQITSNFRVTEVLVSNNNFLSMKADGLANVNRNRVAFDDMMIEFNKNTNSVDFESDDIGLELNGMETVFVEGCMTKTDDYVVLHDEGTLEDRRSIEDVRSLLNNNKELLDAYEGLGSVFTDYWFLTLPPSFIS